MKGGCPRQQCKAPAPVNALLCESRRSQICSLSWRPSVGRRLTPQSAKNHLNNASPTADSSAVMRNDPRAPIKLGEHETELKIAKGFDASAAETPK